MVAATPGAVPGARRALPQSLLVYTSAWATPAAVRALRRASRDHAAALRPPEVPSDVLDQLYSHLPVRREVAFSKLEELARQGAGDAIRAVVTSVGDESQAQELRKWGLEAVKDITEPGEEWAIKAIVRPGGPLWSQNSNVAKKAIEVLPTVADSGNASAIAALAAMLGDGRFSCRASLTIARIAEGARSIDSAAVQAVLAQLRDASTQRARANAVTALGHVGRGGDAAVIQELQARAGSGDEDLRRRAVAALARVSGPADALNSSGATGASDGKLQDAAKPAFFMWDADR